MIPKFRAWGVEKDYGLKQPAPEMHYNVSVVTTHPEGITFVLTDFNMWGDDEYSGSLIEDAILMQSTGLKDKNGKEIFEGDVIAIEVDDTETPINARVFQNSKIGILMFHVFEDNEDVPMVELLEDNSVAFKIIGNIYENPELLEVES